MPSNIIENVKEFAFAAPINTNLEGAGNEKFNLSSKPSKVFFFSKTWIDARKNGQNTVLIAIWERSENYRSENYI